MTKEHILRLTKSQDIMKALAEDFSLLDQEISDHLRDIKKKELIARFGSDDILYTPAKKINSKALKKSRFLND